MKPSNRIHQTTWRTLAAALLAIGLTACAGITEPSHQDRLAKAQAMFAERCKTAGEKIYRTVDNVEGIYLLKVRPEQNIAAQFVFDDPYGRDMSGDGYIESFVRGSSHVNDTSPSAPGAPPRLGYLYVEAINTSDGKRYRYTGRTEEPWQYNKAYLKGYIRFVMDKTPAPGVAPRYAVTYDDISTREEREYWIAGSSLKVVDLQTNEVIAERVGYMMDPGQGSQVGGRAPWLMAANYACPSFYRNPNYPRHSGPAFAVQPHQAQDFVEKILKPKQ